MKNLVRCLYFIPFCFLCACPSKDPGPTQSQEVVIKGDPMTFIANTVQDNESGIPVSLFDQDSQWMIYTLGFRTQEQVSVKSMEQAESQNKAPTLDVTKKIKDSLLLYDMAAVPQEMLASNNDSFYLKSDEHNTLKFTKFNDSLLLTGFYGSSGAEGVPPEFQVHHYSVHTDQRAFSVLVSFSHEGKKYLNSLNFIKHEEKGILEQTLDNAYNYLFGPGVKMAWPQDRPLKSQICNTGTMVHYADVAEAAILDWSDPLENRLEIKVERRTSCPPYSDLNTQSVFHVKGWVEILEKDRLTAAFAPGIPNFYKSQIIDADIFFLESEWDDDFGEGLSLSSQEIYENFKVKAQYRSTIKHEFGHVLGLHHIFDEKTDSIMGYRGYESISAFDRNFVQALYPLKEAEEIPLGP